MITETRFGCRSAPLLARISVRSATVSFKLVAKFSSCNRLRLRTDSVGIITYVKPIFHSFMQSLRSNKSLHFTSVENPPVKVVQLILEQRMCFLSFSDSGTGVRHPSCKLPAGSCPFSRTFAHPSCRLRASSGGVPRIIGISFWGTLHLGFVQQTA